jgi:hypothetical protein
LESSWFVASQKTRPTAPWPHAYQTNSESTPSGLIASSAPVNESAPAGELNRVHVAASQLGRLRRCLFLRGIERVKVQPMPFPAETKG